MNLFQRILLSLCLAVIVIQCPAAHARIDNIHFSNIGISNGLSHNCVYSILHDSRGFMWFGTHEGLCRYDGYTMRIYNHHSTDSFSLPDNAIRCLLEDSRGRLWVGTPGGLALYDRDKDRFERIPISYSTSSKSVLRILETEGTLYISTSNDLLRFDEQENIFRSLYGIGDRSPLPASITDIAENGEGSLWIVSAWGAWLFDPSRPDSISVFSHPEAGPVQNPTAGLTLARDERGRIWFSEWNGVGIYDPADGSFHRLSPADGLGAGIVRAIEFDSDGNAWVGGENGLDIISPQGVVRHISQGISDVTGISDNAIYAIHRDNHGNMWIGTYFGGVNVMFRNSSDFSRYSYGFSDSHLSGKAVRQIIADGDSALWIATEDGGLNRLDRRTNKFTHYTGHGKDMKFSYHNVHALHKDNRGDLWIGTFSGSLNRYDLLTGRTTRYYLFWNGIEADMIFALLEDKDGDLWIGTTYGLFVKRASSETIELVKCPELSATFIYSMACDSDGFLWLGTRYQGLFCYDKNSDTAIRIPEHDSDLSFVTMITTDPSGNIWAGTNNGGVIRFDRGLKRSTIYTTDDGLPSNLITGIVFDNNEEAWISTNHGLCRFSQDPSRIKTYTTSDGLPTNQFNYSSAFKAADGELFFGSVSGMISFHPDRIDSARPPLKVEFTDLQTGNREVSFGRQHSPLEKDISQVSSVRLTQKQASSVGFGFTALNFSHAASIRYAIRMEGASSEWQDLGSEHRVLFSNLRHGRYTLSVKASYDGVEWDEAGTGRIDIQVMPPFWLSVWAMLTYAVLAAGAATTVWFFIRSRIRLRNQMYSEAAAKLQAEEMSRQKTVFFGNLSHDLKTPLSLILGPLHKVAADPGIDPDTRDTLSAALRNTQRMKNLLEELVMMSKIEMSHLDVTVRQGDVLEFIDRMCDIFRVFAGETGINYFVAIDNHEGRKVWFSPTNIERIVYNLLSNAFKFTSDGGMIRIKAWLYEGPGGEDMLGIHVNDTGEGIDPADHEKIFENYYTTSGHGKFKGAGIGLALTRSLVKLHGGDISVESTLGEGALFKVRINVDRAAYTDEQISMAPVETGDKAVVEYADGSNDYLRRARIEIQNRSRDLSKSRILVVEDSRELNEFIGRIFSGDFEVLTAYDGMQGFEIATREVPDIIITDIVMPEMDGLEMTQRLKNEIVTSHIPIAMLTARSNECEKIEGFECGADAYIEKPFNPQRLELQVRNLLNTRRRNIERFKHDTTFDAKKLTRNPRDEKFLSSVVDVIMKDLGNDSFAVKDITDALCISRSLLHIKLKSLADLSVTEFIRNIRMKEARKRLIEGMNVSETSFAVGISDPNYFSKCFKKQFGQTPSDFIRTLKNNNLTNL